MVERNQNRIPNETVNSILSNPPTDNGGNRSFINGRHLYVKFSKLNKLNESIFKGGFYVFNSILIFSSSEIKIGSEYENLIFAFEMTFRTGDFG